MIRFKPYLEFKYPVSFEQKDLFLSEVIGFLKSDQNGNNGVYRVSSVYFDTKNFDFFYDKIEGEFYKIKIRLRRYCLDSNNVWSSPKLELKIKKGNETIKISKKLSFEQEQYFLNNSILLTDLLEVFNESSIPTEKLSGKVFYPVVDVVYRREAYTFDYLPGTRVTFDSKIFVTNKHVLKEYKTCFDNTPLYFPDYHEILEIKSNTIVPEFLILPLQNIGVTKENISKYGIAVESFFEL